MGRDVRISFKLTEEKRDELQEMANSYGVTMSGLSALIIGQWLHQQNRVINPMVEGLTAMMREQLQSMMEDEETMYQIITKMKEEQKRA